MNNNHVFHNRQEAGEALAERLELYRDDPNALVLGLPRGGVVVAAAVSRSLNLPLDVFLARKISAPCQEGCALAGIAETGVVYINEGSLCAQECLQRDLRVFIEHEIEFHEREFVRLRRVYRSTEGVPHVAGRRVILIDEGIVSGEAVFASIDALRKLGVSSIVGAFPVAAPEVLRDARYAVDELVVLVKPEKLRSIRDYYAHFPDVSDSEAAQLILGLQSGLLKRRA